ncbi:hypothetical protein EJB05_16826 [Eragrostis curvula]|uniref:Uncharacterized protein n=1 Tax=Eragrostis curvula TaxID=38414 RepID=A0A5J9VHK7_9POAL|nr:hypothetical protein EJB05_16808 [Eragrostis curvula]TVU34967.1 hypothetical protein EJB05_16826 [Eragrostis curvula]
MAIRGWCFFLQRRRSWILNWASVVLSLAYSLCPGGAILGSRLLVLPGRIQLLAGISTSCRPLPPRRRSPRLSRPANPVIEMDGDGMTRVFWKSTKRKVTRRC